MAELSCDIVVGLGFGDEGKGRTTEMFARSNPTKSVVKFSGAQQTAHNVKFGKFHHTYRQFGSATHREIPTVLSRFMLVDPLYLFKEGDVLYEKTGWNPFPDLLISENSLMITPIHIWMNRAREIARGQKRHGSCGLGVGETRKYALYYAEDEEPKMGDLTASRIKGLRNKLVKLKAYAEAEMGETYPETVDSLMETYEAVVSEGALHIVEDSVITEHLSTGYHVFEGTQGVLLDETLGFLPHNTWTSTVPKNALLLLEEAGRSGKVTGIMRSYGTRHGAGPFPSELLPNLGLDWIPDQATLEKELPELHNGTGKFTGAWRRGLLDLALLEYSVRAAEQVDQIMMTHLDLVKPDWKVVTGYDGWRNIPSDYYGNDNRAKEEHTAHLASLSLKDAHITELNANNLVSFVSDFLNVPVNFGSVSLEAETEVRLS